MRKLVSTKRAYGKKEHATVSTRGEVEVGISFYIKTEHKISTENLKKALRDASGEDMSWGEPQTLQKTTLNGVTILYFPVQFRDEEIETAGNETVKGHLHRVDNASIYLEVLEKKVKKIVEKLWGMNIDEVRSISCVSNIRSTLN